MRVDAATLERTRAEVLTAMGARGPVCDELLAYNQMHFQESLFAGQSFPLDDEPFVEEWSEYAREVTGAGTLAALERYLVQLRFPVQAGISATQTYITATRRGAHARGSNAPALAEPERGSVRIYETPAGRLPAIVAGSRGDFVALVRMFTGRNEPIHVPDSMGACVVAGYNNWNRIQRLRGEWLAKNSAAGWPAEFARIRDNRDLYQDTFLVLSSGPYSAVTGETFGISEPTWLQLSTTIRAEHEAAHYFTRRVFGSMRTSLIDELVADFYALVRVFGSFRASMELHFLGMERFPEYRAGGRLENYRGSPRLGDDAFRILQALVHAAVMNLESFARGTDLTLDPGSSAALLSSLCRLSLEELAAATAPSVLADIFGRLRNRYRTQVAPKRALGMATGSMR